MPRTDREIIDVICEERLVNLSPFPGSVVERTVLTLMSSLRGYHGEETTIEGVTKALGRLSTVAIEISKELKAARNKEDELPP